MWCTRWFVPLLLLPLPTASPYFLIIFLFSLSLHSRPCIYCIVLLSILFVSSCYWSPILATSPLTTPWGENITTFGEALIATLNTTALEETDLPKYIRPVDRCWCDLTSNSLFEPFNTTEWEEASVFRAKHEIERANDSMTSVGNMDEAVDVLLLNDNNSTASSEPTATTTLPTPTGEPTPLYLSILADLRVLYSHLCEIYRELKYPAIVPSKSLVSRVEGPRVAQKGLKPLRSVYDLSSHGFDVIIDFRWSRGN